MTLPPSTSSRTDAVLSALAQLHSDMLALYTRMGELIERFDKNAVDQNVSLEMDSSRLVKPKVSAHGPDLHACEDAAIAAMRRLLTEFPPPPPKEREPR